MTERIYASDGKTVLDARRAGKLYADKGRDHDGASRLVELTDDEQAAREAEWANRPAKPTTREKIIARLKSDAELRALVVAFRDDKGLNNKQVVDLLEARYSDEI